MEWIFWLILLIVFGGAGVIALGLAFQYIFGTIIDDLCGKRPL